MDVLAYLATRPGEVVTREDLENHVWAGTVVGYDTVTGALQKLRKALGDDAHRPRIIETIPKRGYRLIAQVEMQHPPPEPEPPLRPPRRHLQTAVVALGGALVSAAAILGSVWLAQNIGIDLVSGPESSGDAPLIGNPPSLAVLPFTNLSGDPGDDYFSDGVTQDLTTDLAKIPGLTVAASGTVFAYRGSTASPRDLGHELGVRYLLRGSLRKGANRLRINAWLVDAESGYALWADRFEGSLDDIFRLQDGITERIVSALEARLSRASGQRPQDQETPDPEAYDLYLRGTASLAQLSHENLLSARSRFEQAVLADPGFARGYAALANTYSLEAGHWWSPDPRASLQKARELATRSVELAPALPQAHYALARMLRDAGDLERAAEEAKEVIRLEPAYADGHILLASILTYSGNASESLKQYQIALRLNLPQTARYLFHRGQTYFTLGDYPEAIRLFEQGLEQDPNSQRLRVWLAAAYAQTGRTEDAEWLIDEFVMAHPGISAHAIAVAVPYRHQADLQQLIAGLRAAGLPEWEHGGHE
jgi:TolB-like protein/DNA-binding winged helix-turn-helix (wHTH) protein